MRKMSRIVAVDYLHHITHTQAELRSLHGLDEEGILRAAKEMLEQSC